MKAQSTQFKTNMKEETLTKVIFILIVIQLSLAVEFDTFAELFNHRRDKSR